MRLLKDAAPLPEWLVHGASLALVVSMLVAAGQPIFTDDAWIHLALGRAYAQQGPWLAGDPLLFTAPGPPTPAAWLFDLGLYGASRGVGLTGLRLLHVLTVAGILALGWSLLRRAGDSRWIASLGTALFSVLAAYRLVQLRPHLFTILFALLLYRLVIEGRGAPDKGRMALALGLLVIWANTHAAFLLGPLMLAAAALGLICALPLRPRERRRDDRRRALGLAILAVVGLLATALNPGLFEPHLAWFVAGGETPSLGLVTDEWASLSLLRLPMAGLPPSWLVWLLYAGLLIAAPIAAVTSARRWRRADPVAGEVEEAASTSPALVALALGTLAAPLVAVRFSWLPFFALLLLGSTLRPLASANAARALRFAWAAAAAAILLLPGFVRLGPWPMISHGISFAGASYAAPYPASKYFAHAVWFLQDAGLRGNLFNHYFQGGFLGYWLAPEIRTFTGGTLNVTPEVMEAYPAIRVRRGVLPGESFEALLDRQGIDLFFGIRLPEVGHSSRPWYCTTGHLEGSEDWLPVFRNLNSAIYLRKGARNADNLERIAEYYREQGVPFDPARGFETRRVLQQARGWALAHGLVPVGFFRLGAKASDPNPVRRRAALEYLAAIYASLGLYEEAAKLEEAILRLDPDAFSSRRRLVWSLLRSGLQQEARDAALPLEGVPDALSRAIAEASSEVAELDPQGAAARVALLPAFTRDEAAVLQVGCQAPTARSRRP